MVFTDRQRKGIGPKNSLLTISTVRETRMSKKLGIIRPEEG